MGSFTLDGRQPGQLTKMILILLASTLLHLCRGHSLGTDLHMSQHGVEDNQKVEYDLITKAVTYQTPKDNDIMASSTIDNNPRLSVDPARLSSDNTRVKRESSWISCSNIAYRCTPKSNTLAKFANFHYWIKTVNHKYSPRSEIEAVNRGTWNCKMCCDGRREGPLCNCDTIQRTRQGTFSTCLLHDLAVARFGGSFL